MAYAGPDRNEAILATCHRWHKTPARPAESAEHTAMTRREHFFAVLEGGRPGAMPFVPDITNWYIARRTPPGEPLQHSVGVYINACRGSMPERFKALTFLDFYREFGWGVHSHAGDWYETAYAGPIERVREETPSERRVRLRTPRGELVRCERIAADRTWCPCEHFVRNLGDLEIMAEVVEAETYTPRYDRLETALRDIGDLGQIDIVISRSPFGKLVHEYMGFERVIYALHDEPGVIRDFLKLQEIRDLEVIRLAAAAPGRLVIISDHADENLIAPPLYERYCIPFYRKACDILHQAGKFVSTHLDGNFRGFFPLLGATGFDLLDGCTPAPMFNFEVEELAGALAPGMTAFCGVPATLFCQHLPTPELLDFADRIRAALAGRGILNVGDVLPPDGDIEQVIALGEG